MLFSDSVVTLLVVLSSFSSVYATSSRSEPKWLLNTLKRRQNTAKELLPARQATAILSILDRTATDSWEIGTHYQALTEYLYPTFSPFRSNYLKYNSRAHRNSRPTKIIDGMTKLILAKPANQGQLVPDSAAGDPPSIGPAIMTASLVLDGWAQASKTMMFKALDLQVEELFVRTPRAPNGAISHRRDEVSLWNDNLYMVPPFLALYGVHTQNTSLISTAVAQIQQYRAHCYDKKTKLWRHIRLGEKIKDGNIWATGNGWVAAGILRVYATIQNSRYASRYSKQLALLGEWAEEVVVAGFAKQNTHGFIPNYLNTVDFPNAYAGESTSTLMFAYASYRLASLGISTKTIPQAHRARRAAYSRVRSDGVLEGTVNPVSWRVVSSVGTGNTEWISPEGQSFVLLVDAAYRDWLSLSS